MVLNFVPILLKIAHVSEEIELFGLAREGGFSLANDESIYVVAEDSEVEFEDIALAIVCENVVHHVIST